MLPTLITVALQVVSQVLTLIPESDPEIRRLRVLHHQERMDLAQKHRIEHDAARLGRRA